MAEKTYLAIDLKSFYASVECRDRGLDPMVTNLVVADTSRTEKTICLAVSPALKSYGISGRPRLFEVIQQVREINALRRGKISNHGFFGTSCDRTELDANPQLAVDYLVAPPQMARYMQISTQIYGIYLRYIAPEDIHVYSIDEVFIDATPYLNTYQMTAKSFAAMMLQDVFHTTGITATAGIGTNLYLAKVAMDLVAKHLPPDKNGVRIAELDEMSYRQQLWNHTPLTDFWRVGRGYQKKLAYYGIHTMGDIARCSCRDDALLFRLFGVNAELLIDHAWGWEPCTIADIKAYQPESTGFSSGQVLQEPYTFARCRIVIREMAEHMALDLVEKGLLTPQLVLTVGYDIENLNTPEKRSAYHGEVVTDPYGRQIPKHAHGTANLAEPTSSTHKITEAVLHLYDRIVNQGLLIRRVTISVNKVIPENSYQPEFRPQQLDLFTDAATLEQDQRQRRAQMKRERKIQDAMLSIRHRFGKNAILTGTSFQDGATAIQRNQQIGGHRA